MVGKIEDLLKKDGFVKMNCNDISGEDQSRSRGAIGSNN